jgi:multidrug efflux system membrane fusion protein
MRRPTAFPLILALAAAVSCQKREQPKPGGAHLRKPKVILAEAALREIEYTVEAVGSLEAAEEISIPARVSGPLDAVHFKEGDAVNEKTVLAEIEVEKYSLGAERAQAEFDRARAQDALAETVYKNRLTLYEEGKKQKKEWVTEEQMATWKADFEKAKADLERTRVDLELARRSHRDARVTSPIAGLINRKLVSKGEFVKPETIVATILNVSTLRVRFTVPEVEASRLRTGQEVQFSVQSAPGLRFKARIFFMSQKADPVTRAVDCMAEVLDRNEMLRAGTFASVRAVTGKQKSILIPERAVLPSEKGFLVLVLNSSCVKSRVVKLGLRVGGDVEVTEGLSAGDRVVADGGAGLTDGKEVEVVEGGPK